MRKYERPYVAKGIAALYAHFEKAEELSALANQYRNTYQGEKLQDELDRLQSEYSESYNAARQAAEEMWAGSIARIEELEFSQLSTAGAEEDYKLLSLPVTLNKQELLHLARKNENNPLFLRAVKEYADSHGYDTKDFAFSAAANHRLYEAKKAVEGLKATVEKYYRDCEFLRFYSPDLAARFTAVENAGCFDSL